MNRADKRKFHYIYKITRLDGSGKYYIGMHSTDDMDDGYFGSGQRISRSIKKHGKEAHSKEVLEFLPSRAELKAREKELITDELRADVLCMNIAPGGGGGFINEAHRQKFVGSSRTAKLRGTEQARNATAKALKTKLERGTLVGGTYKGGTPSFLGKTHHAEAKLKIGLAAAVNQLGEKNSQFGSCWVTDGVKPVKIKKEQIDEFIANGFVRGRK